MGYAKKQRGVFSVFEVKPRRAIPQKRKIIYALFRKQMVAVGESARTLRLSSKKREGDPFHKRRISAGEYAMRHPKRRGERFAAENLLPDHSLHNPRIERDIARNKKKASSGGE